MEKQWKQWQIFLGGLENHCKWWLQPWNKKTLTPWKKSYDQSRQLIKKQRHYFVHKVRLFNAMVLPVFHIQYFHVWVWELDYKESWAPKNWCFWTVVLEKTLRVLWTARRSNQSILKEISPGCSLEGLMLKLKLHYFAHLMRRADSLEKTLMLGKIEGRRRRGRQRMRWPTQWTWVCVSFRRRWMTRKPGVLPSVGSQRVGQDWATEQ